MKRLGVLINTIYSDYSILVLKGVEQFCAKNNCDFFVFPLAHGANSGLYDYHYETLMDFINKNNIDGLLVVSTTLIYDVNLTSLVNSIKKLPGIPKVSMGLEIEDIPTVRIDCKSAIEKLVEHLIEKHGVKTPLVMRCSKGNVESDEREQYVLENFAKHGIQIGEERVLNGSFLFDNAYSALSSFIRKNGLDFDAVICLNDTMAMGVIRCLADYDLKIPQDKIVTGFDNIFETSSEELNITTIDQRVEKFAFASLEKLFKIINGVKVEKLKLIDATPIFRGSCGCSENAGEYEETLFFSRKRYEILRMSGIQLYMLHYFLMETQTPVPLENLYNRLHYSLGLFEIRAFVMVLYEEPVFYDKDSKFERPNAAKLTMTFFNGDSFERPDIIFNPNVSIIPSDIAEKISGGYTVFPLFAEKIQYGYLLFKFGRYESIFYQTIFELITKEIITSIKLTFEQSEKDSLKNQNISLEEYSQKMHALSFTDDLTGLLNRRGFYEYAKRKISQLTENGNGGLLIYCDMDDLKKINDTYGHDAGDRAIKYEAKILKSIFRSSDILGRLGGDEFAIVAGGMAAKDFSRVKKSLAAECEKINTGTLEPFVLSLSCGFAEFSSEKNDIDELLSSADSAQYEDKRKKKEKAKKKSWFGKK